MSGTCTVRDVAAHAGVSIGTVSRVLNGHEDVDPGLAQRVRSAVAELGYVRPVRRSSGRRRSSPIGTIGFLLTSSYLHGREDLMAPFWAQILHGAEAEAARHGVTLTYRSLPGHAESLAALPDRLAAAQVDACLLVGSATAEVVEAVRRLGLPLGLVDMESPTDPIDAVLSDGLGGARRAVEYLLRRGHRDVAFVGGPFAAGGLRSGIPVSTVHAIEQRLLGYQVALSAAGIPLRDALIQECDLQPDSAEAATRRLLSSGVPFTAVFCGNDPTAVSVLRVLRDAGVRVPEQVSVVGFDDDIAAHTVPALTTVRVHKEAMGAIAVRRLLDRAARPYLLPHTITTPVELVERGSVADAPRREEQ